MLFDLSLRAQFLVKTLNNEILLKHQAAQKVQIL